MRACAVVRLGRRRLRMRDGLEGRFAVRSARDRRALHRVLADGLDELALRAHRPAYTAIDVQLVTQVCAAPSYAELKRSHERAWRRQGGRYTTASWPAQLAEAEFAAVLLPLGAGRVGVAAGRHPKLVASPIFSCGTPAGGELPYDDLVLGLVARWVANPGDGQTARLAPPVVELVQRGRVIERRVVDFDQRWPLPPPDGV